MPRLILQLLVLAATACLGAAAESRSWTIDGLARTAVIYPPRSPAGPAPVVFVFHGHGGTANQAAQSIAVHQAWPEALVVYPQGLPITGVIVDKKGRLNGWDIESTDPSNRDLRFFDAMWATLRADYAVDSARVYATGHSNGGAFTYVLWAHRRSLFAAFAPSGAVASRTSRPLEPAPVIQISGLDDPLVRYSWQETMIESLRRLNRCGEPAEQGPHLRLYPSSIDCPLETYVYPGGHTYPAKATALVVAFFKANPRH
jgi:polyhydroxybutyrate depolymerase